MKTVCPKIYLQICPFGWISKNPVRFFCDLHIKFYLEKLWSNTRPFLHIVQRYVTTLLLTFSKSGHHHQGFTRSRIRPQIMVKIFATPTWVTLWWEAKTFFFPSNFEKVAESQNGIFIFVPCLSKNCPNASELFDYLCNLL